MIKNKPISFTIIHRNQNELKDKDKIENIFASLIADYMKDQKLKEVK